MLDRTQSHKVESPKDMAVGRLQHLQQFKGTPRAYSYAPTFGQDAFISPAPRFAASAKEARLDLKTHVRQWAPALRNTAKVGVVAAASILGGMVGGGLIGVVLAGLTVSGLLASFRYLRQKPASSVQAEVKTVSPGDNPFAKAFGNISTSDDFSAFTAMRRLKSAVALENASAGASGGPLFGQALTTIADIEDPAHPIEMEAPDRLDIFAEKNPIEDLVDAETRRLYRSAVRNRTEANAEDNLVVVFGSDGVVLAFGHGDEIDEELTANAGLGLGPQEVILSDPFNAALLEPFRDRVRSLLEKGLPYEIEAQRNQPRRLWVGQDAMMALLAGIESERTGHDIKTQGLPVETINWYLGEEGLEHLRGIQTPENETALPQLIKTLVMLSEISRYMNAENVQVGGETTQYFAEQLHQGFRQDFEAAHQVLDNVFADVDAVQIMSRVKDPNSIEAKLVRKSGESPPVSLDEARALIRDGMGWSVVMEDDTEATVSRLVQRLEEAILAGDIQLLKIDNYHGGWGKADWAYLKAEHIQPLRQAAMVAQREAGVPVQEIQPVTVVGGPNGGYKESGFTATQFNIRVRNPETGEFFEPIAELKILGQKVHEFFEIEHLLYDIRQGKDPYKGREDVRAALAPRLEKVVRLFDENNPNRLREEQIAQFEGYLSDYYWHCRQLESTPGYAEEPPARPVSLPDVLDVDNLRRLREAQMRLLEKEQVPPALKHLVLREALLEREPVLL